MIVWILTLLLGMVVGLLSAFIGIGGGVVMVPALPLLFSLTAAESAATSLMAIFLVTLLNVWNFRQYLQGHWRAGVSLGLVAGTTSFATAMAVAQMPPLWIKLAFAVLLIFLLIFVLLDSNSASQRSSPGGTRWPQVILAGVGSGVMAGGTGVGAGLIAGPLMDRLQLVDASRLIPMVNLMMLFNSGFGVVGFASSGLVRWPVAGVVFLGAQIAAPWAIRHQNLVPELWRRRLLVALLFLLSIGVWWSWLRDYGAWEVLK